LPFLLLSRVTADFFLFIRLRFQLKLANDCLIDDGTPAGSGRDCFYAGCENDRESSRNVNLDESKRNAAEQRCRSDKNPIRSKRLRGFLSGNNELDPSEVSGIGQIPARWYSFSRFVSVSLKLARNRSTSLGIQANSANLEVKFTRVDESAMNSTIATFDRKSTTRCDSIDGIDKFRDSRARARARVPFFSLRFSFLLPLSFFFPNEIDRTRQGLHSPFSHAP